MWVGTIVDSREDICLKKIVSVSGIEELSSFTAKTIVEQAKLCLDKSGRFSLVLSGGNTPKFVFDTLASEYGEEVFWSQIDVFWVDERCVPPSHADSNYGLANDHLLTKIKVKHSYRMEGELSPSIAANNYERQMNSYFGLSAGELPRFDFMLLGVGADGHVASLFSIDQITKSNSHLVAAPYIEKLSTYRMTMTLPVINNCAYCLVMVNGEAKRDIVREAWSKKSKLPIGEIRLTDGIELWVTDYEL